ncbi:unnamed protein product [Caenorhabditis bovis]|uniref:Uncharacterized protein n=1 Tax=Caenorhabditis bovis TaxID=2654633 RepID=A0A8S1FEP1_9PELO|nr:unnamed protein product [Caenorhabditis bovis]
MYSMRTRSGSVERCSSSSRDPAPYRTSYGRERERMAPPPATNTTTTSRMSRATSYDPFGSSARSSSVIRSNPLSTSDYSSSSYSRPSISSRYGSIDQLNSYKYRSSGSTSSGASSSYTTRSTRAGSVIGAYDSTNRDYSTSRYRPSDSAYSSKYRSADLSDYTSKYRSPDNSSRASSTSSSSSYTSRSNFEYRTASTSSYRSTNTYRRDREYKSMSRTNDDEEDDVESTFRKLYKKYVTESDSETESLAEQVTKRFQSKSEAEESDESLCEDDEMLAKHQKKGLRRASSASSITPRASVCNSANATPKCSPLPARKQFNEVKDVSSSSSESEEDEGKSQIAEVLSDRQKFMEKFRDVEMIEAKIEARDVAASPSHKIVQNQKIEERIEAKPLSRNIQMEATIGDAKPTPKIVSAIKINGIPVKSETADIGEKSSTSANEPVRLVMKRNRSKSPNRHENADICDRRSAEPPIIKTSAVVESIDDVRAKSEEIEQKAVRRRRIPNRTLENLKNSLMAEQAMNLEKKEEDENKTKIDEVEKKDEVKPRKIPIPLVLITAPSTPSTPLATTPVATSASVCLWNKRASTSSDDDDEDVEEEDEFSSGEWTEGEDEEQYESDCEFSVSQTFSLKGHIPLGELYPLATSSSNSSARVSEFDGDAFLEKSRKEESRGRVDSLLAKPAPTFTCSVSFDGEEDDDDEWGSDEVHSCEEGDDDDFRVLPIARPDSTPLGAYMSPGSITSDEDYDGRTVGCTLKLVDKAARKDSDESDESEYYEDEEEYWDEEYEYEDEDEEEYEYEDEEELEEYYDEEEEMSSEDVTMKSVEFEETSEIVDEIQEIDIEESIEKKLAQLTPMTVSQVEEMFEEAEVCELPDEQLFELDQIEVEDYTGKKDVNIIPTFVRETTENIKEERASRFADAKPSTDFAKKAIIQPAKLEKVQIAKVETKVMEEKPKPPPPDADVKTEDKSAIRKSALNMKEEDAKRKAESDEKAAAQKARRYGTVSALTDKFKKTADEPIV